MRIHPKQPLSNLFVLILLFALTPFAAYGNTCEETMKQAKDKYKEEIEKEFSLCGDDDEDCISKVTKRAKEHPYLDEYKKCKRLS